MEPAAHETASTSAIAPPSRLWTRPFVGFLATQFLGAFNDNIYKQTVLLLCLIALETGVIASDFQGTVSLLFVVPFLLFTSIAGDIADRFSKGRVIVACKVAEIVVMLAGVAVFAMGLSGGTLWLLGALAFVMGAQSAFFGPPKYGVIPELVRNRLVPPASGAVQLTTMVAIVVGIALAGVLLENIGTGRVWVIGLICAALAIAGTVTSLMITRNPATAPHRKVNLKSTLSVFPTINRIRKHDRLLWFVILSYSWFWGMGATVLVAVNAWGKLQIRLGEGDTSLMVAAISLGIGVGAAFGGWLSRGRVRLGLCIPGALLLVGCLIGMALLPVASPLVAVDGQPPSPADLALKPDTGIVVSAFVLVALLGVGGGLFSVPLLAFLQVRPKPEDKGRVIAANNFINWVLIFVMTLGYAFSINMVGQQASVIIGGLGVSTGVVLAVLLPFVIRRGDSETRRMAIADAGEALAAPQVPGNPEARSGESTPQE